MRWLGITPLMWPKTPIAWEDWPLMGAPLALSNPNNTRSLTRKLHTGTKTDFLAGFSRANEVRTEARCREGLSPWWPPREGNGGAPDPGCRRHPRRGWIGRPSPSRCWVGPDGQKSSLYPQYRTPWPILLASGQQPQAQARLARMTVHPLGVMAPLFCLLNQALLLKLKLTIVLLLGLLLKAKVRLGVFSALGGLVALLNLLVVTALVAALVLQQRQKPAAVG